MDSENGSRAGRQLVAHLLGRQIVADGIHVAEDGRQAGPDQGLRRGGECEGRHDHLARHLERPGQDHQSHGTVGDGYGVPHAEEFGEGVLELLHQGAVVGVPAAFKDAPECCLDGFHGGRVELAHVQGLREGRRAAEQRQIGDVPHGLPSVARRRTMASPSRETKRSRAPTAATSSREVMTPTGSCRKRRARNSLTGSGSTV